MTYILLKNKGVIETAAFQLLGASTKRDDDTKIGFFGSGLKYAVSYMLRENLFFRVFAGKEQVQFTTEEVNLRGETFQNILVNGNPTSLTTSWGINWTKWQIFRELVSNAVDEGLRDIEIVNEVEPVEGETRVYLKESEFSKYIENLEDYFIWELWFSPDESSKNMVIPKKEEDTHMVVYKKGIRVVPEEYTRTSLFNYNFDDITISEERLASEYHIRANIADTLMKQEIPVVIAMVLKHVQNESIPSDLQMFLEEIGSLYCWSHFGKTWLEVLNEYEGTLFAASSKRKWIEKVNGPDYIEGNNIKFIPDDLFNKLKVSFGDEWKTCLADKNIQHAFQICEDNEYYTRMIDNCLQACEKVGVFIKEPIQVCEFEKDTTLGLALDGNIYISNKCFDKGTNFVLETLLEEHVHCKHKVSDCTREMQDIMFGMMSRLILEK